MPVTGLVRFLCNNDLLLEPTSSFPVRPSTTSALTMTKIPAIAILVVGIILLVYGLNASDSAASSISNAVTGSPTDKSIWLIALGVVGILTGGVGLSLRRSS